MTPTEIRSKTLHQIGFVPADRAFELEILQEIAAQLADLNETLRVKQPSPSQKSPLKKMVVHTPLPDNLAAEKAFRAKRRALALDEGAQVALHNLHDEQLAHDERRERSSSARCLGLVLIAVGVAAVVVVGLLLWAVRVL
jgi:hypothetical protein